LKQEENSDVCPFRCVEELMFSKALMRKQLFKKLPV
jgi:hypothetical protein